MNATLLLREQSALLRLARESKTKGRPIESWNSVVLPGRKWHFNWDSASNSVALRLDQIPKFITDNSVTNPDFWILPLDGSKSWKFRSLSLSASHPGQ